MYNSCMLTTTCNTYPLTLLSPARDVQTAQAAIQAGADAIYIGAARFGARAEACNSLDDIANLVEYARTYGVQVLVTLNTLLNNPEERADAVALAWDLYRVGVDALIIQDLTLLDAGLPPIRLHASTQCDNRTAADIVDRARRGFKRVVLARELSLREIAAIRDAVQAEGQEIELEAFVHGALCVSYSGRCYMSEQLLGRSANRGRCAQMCRMAYDLLDEDGNEVMDDEGKTIHQRYLLSLQDLDRSLSLREMIAAGVTTFKIEGRLKDAEYVTNVTAYYRQLLDKICAETGLHCASYASIYERDFTPNPEKSFHRGGTDYFLHERNSRLANWQTPKSTGEPIGTLVRKENNYLIVRLKDGITLHNGDGLTLGAVGCAVNGIERLANDMVRIRINQSV